MPRNGIVRMHSDVMDMVLESSSSATEAVSSLASMAAALESKNTPESATAGESEISNKGDGDRAPQDTEEPFPRGTVPR